MDLYDKKFKEFQLLFQALIRRWHYLCQSFSKILPQLIKLHLQSSYILAHILQTCSLRPCPSISSKGTYTRWTLAVVNFLSMGLLFRSASEILNSRCNSNTWIWHGWAGSWHLNLACMLYFVHCVSKFVAYSVSNSIWSCTLSVVMSIFINSCILTALYLCCMSS